MSKFGCHRLWFDKIQECPTILIIHDNMHLMIINEVLMEKYSIGVLHDPQYIQLVFYSWALE